jgi:hypothetical protein
MRPQLEIEFFSSCTMARRGSGPAKTLNAQRL